LTDFPQMLTELDGAVARASGNYAEKKPAETAQ
jgi:hypothetical protein